MTVQELSESGTEIARLSAAAIKAGSGHADEVDLLGSKLKTARASTVEAEQVQAH